MEVVDTTCVLHLESGFEDRLEDKLDNQAWAIHLPRPGTWWGSTRRAGNPVSLVHAPSLTCFFSGPGKQPYRKKLVPQRGDRPSQEASCHSPKGSQHHFT